MKTSIFALTNLCHHEILYLFINHQHQTVLPKSRYFTVNSGTEAAVLPRSRYSNANSGTKVAVLLGMNRYGSFPLLSAPHSLFSFWTDLKRGLNKSLLPIYICISSVCSAQGQVFANSGTMAAVLTKDRFSITNSRTKVAVLLWMNRCGCFPQYICGKQQETTAPPQSLVKLQPWFLCLGWKAYLRQNWSLGSCAWSKGPALRQNTMMIYLEWGKDEKKNPKVYRKLIITFLLLNV